MKILTSKKDLLGIMQKAFPVIPSKSTMQALSNFKMSYSGNYLEITATDLDHSIKVKQAASGAGEFDILVNAKKIFEIVRELPEGNETIAVDENIFIIESEKGFSCRIAGTDTSDFPSFPVIEEKTSFDIRISQLSSMIAKSSFAVSKDESRMCLCGILWEIEENRMGMVATDGHRLGNSVIIGNFNVSSKISVIVSPKSLLHIVRIMGADAAPDAVIHVSVGDKYVLFSNDSVQICSKLIDGPYPDYKKVIPVENPKKALLQRTVLADAVRRVGVLSNQKTNLIKCIFREQELELVVLNRDIGGEARELIPVDYNGEEHAIGFNGQYLSEILNILSFVPTVRIEMSTQIGACLIFPEFEDPSKKESDDLFLIMPLKIMEEM